ncbi:MAG: patatin-like phospholipase family protein [Thermodesulfobacteriota bacterium]
MIEPLVWYAGEKVLAQIREAGFCAQDVSIVAGAAGGPKWLILRHLDAVLCGSWFADRREKLFLLGSSIGAWRFAAWCRPDPKAALSDFEAAYLDQFYARPPTAEEVTAESLRIQQAYFGPDGAREILAHPVFRLNCMAVRCRDLSQLDIRPVLASAIGCAAFANAIDRKLLGFFFERVLFSDPRDLPPFHTMNGFPFQRVALTPQNLSQALLASGSIPLVMSGVRNIPGARPGTYRDGGLIDYHLDVPFRPPEGTIVLFPHFGERIVPGWFDKWLSKRRPSGRHLESVLLVAPSREFVSRLPLGKISDRTDFKRFFGRDAERLVYWKTVLDAGRILADAFMEAVESGSVRHRVQPFSR